MSGRPVSTALLALLFAVVVAKTAAQSESTEAESIITTPTVSTATVTTPTVSTATAATGTATATVAGGGDAGTATGGDTSQSTGHSGDAATSIQATAWLVLLTTLGLLQHIRA